MNAKQGSLIVMGLAALLFGCASAPRSEENSAEEVKLYDPSQLSLGQYDTVEHLWVESWRTAVWYPSYSSREDGVNALKAQAARAGANGVIDVSCSEDAGIINWSSKPQLICYGLAIRVH